MIDQDKILALLKRNLKDADSYRKAQDAKIMSWKAEYNGELYGNEEKGKSKIVDRSIKKQDEWQHAYLVDPFVSNPDIIKASPITSNDLERARQTEILLNTQFCRQFDRYNFVSKAVKVLTTEGTCVVQTGWEYEDKVEEVEVPIIGTDPITGQQMIVGTEMKEQLVVVKNQPTAKVCRNQDVFIDPTCQDNLDDAQFVIYRYETDMTTLLNEAELKGYKNLNKIMKELSDDEYDTDYVPEDTTLFKFSDKARKKLIIYEYWGNLALDGGNQAKPIVCSWIGDTIIRLQDNPYPDKKVPFVIAPFNPVPFKLYGEANAEMISDSQKILTAIKRGMIDNLANSNNGQKGIKKGSLDIVNRKRYLKGQNFEFNGSISDFYDGNYNQLPSSIFNVFQMEQNSIDSITGVKSFQGGVNGNALGNTATGIRGALDATATRRLNQVRNISENLIKPLLRKWIAYNGEFLDESQVVRVTENEFVEVMRDDVTGVIDLDIEVSTAEDNANKAQQISFMMQTLGQNMDEEMRNLMLSEIATLYKMPRLAKKIKEYQPQPNPFQEKMAELEVALKQAQVQNEFAKAKENEVDVQLKTWKAELEKAKARNLDSKSDKQDLEFLKEESGVGFEQEVYKKQLEQQNKKMT